MSDVDALHNLILEQTVDAVCSQGLDDVSLRAIAAAAGCSTTAVIQRFTNKAGLLDAALEFALRRDSEFHQDFSAQLEGLPISYAHFSELIASYIEQRATLAIARFWSEILFKSNQVHKARAELERWYAVRVNFWKRQLANDGMFEGSLAPLIAAYSAMEEVYAYELVNNVQYKLLLRETTRALVANSFDAGVNGGSGDLSLWLNKGSARFQSLQSSDANELGETLVELAADDILAQGIGSLSQRRLAKRAGTSSSMIVYHFGNMANFVNQAVWHALLRDIPKEINPDFNESIGVKQKNMSEWVAAIKKLTAPKIDDNPAGFYTDYARLTGQACLLATRRKELRPLVEHLRKIDGWGTFRAGQTIWPTSLVVKRGSATAFGVWIKGQSVFNEAVCYRQPISTETLLSAAELIFSKQ
jgi:AcrR family transcriptional regulator